MAYSKKGSNSRYGKSNTSKGGGRGNGSKGKGKGGQKKDYDPKVATVSLRDFEPEEYVRGKKYPAMTGYVNIKKAFLSEVAKQPVNDEYGTYQNVRIAVWEDDRGGFFGNISVYVPEGDADDDDEDEDEDEYEEEEELDDIPF